SEPTQIELHRLGLIGASVDRAAPFGVEGIDALNVMVRYGRAFVTGTGVYSDVFDQAWSLHDLADLTGALEGATFHIMVDPEGAGMRRRAVAYLDGHRYTLDFLQEVDTDGVEAMLALLNGMLSHQEQPERFVAARLDDYGATFVVGEPQALRAGRDAGLLDFYLPDSF
ncbi:MAG: hypothetical protein AAFX76_14750, partial [Planctomycetota bacterium]